VSDRTGSPLESSDGTAHDSDRSATSDIDDELMRLELESNRRSAELKTLAAAVPAVMSRRAVVAAMIADLRRAPDKWTVARRVVTKVARLPVELFGKLTAR
jgi:hypothetical protein